MTRICFIDTETTSLRHDRRAWEVAVIVCDPDNGYDDQPIAWFIEEDNLDLGNADVQSLRIGRFHERHPQFKPNGRDVFGLNVSTAYTVAREIEALTRDAIIVGAVPDFDTHVLGQLLRGQGSCPAWHYHLVDVETLAAGALKMPPPWDFKAVLDAYGLAYPDGELHTALGDAKMARDLYDAIYTTPYGARLGEPTLLAVANDPHLHPREADGRYAHPTADGKTEPAATN